MRPRLSSNALRRSPSPVYEDHIKKVCAELELTCKRADDIFGASQIINDVWGPHRWLQGFIADCTGRNPNVFYELGIAPLLGQSVEIVAQAEADIPFDIRHIVTSSMTTLREA